MAGQNPCPTRANMCLNMGVTTPTSQPPRTIAGLAKAVVADLATRSNLGIAAGAGIVGLLGLGGGLDEAQPHAILSATSTAEPISAAPFDITVNGSYVADGTRVVELQMRNTANRPVDVTSLNLMFGLEDPTLPADQQPRLHARTVRLVGSVPGQVPFGPLAYPNPGVPVDVAVIFDNAPENATTLVIESLEYRKSFLDGSQRWFTKDRAAEVAL